MEWQIFGVIVSIFAFAVAVATPVLKLNKSINVLTVHVENFEKMLSDVKDDNRADHDEFKQKLDDHETRISVSEKDIAVLQVKT